MASRAYIDFSYEEAGSGLPLVLLHAFPQTRMMWSRQLQVLSRDFRVLCPDLFNLPLLFRFLTSHKVIDAMADAIAIDLQYLGIEKPIIGGVSMGGYVALAIARRHPQVLGGLVLASTRADADSPEARMARETMIGFAREHTARELIEEAARIAEPISNKTIVATLEALRDRPDARPDLGSIKVPTLILVGDEDVVSPVESAREMERAIPNTRLQVLPGPGHFAQMEQPNAWNAAVRDWAEENDWI